MRVLYIVPLAILPIANASLPLGTFSYKPDSDYAPIAWPGIFLGDDIKNQCGGSKQSGIDIPTHPCDVFDDYIFEGGSCSLDDMEFKINDHTIIATYNTTKNGCSPPQMRIPGQGKAFDALQFHFHTGSDHALDGRYFGADMHLVHQEVGGSGRLSVLGFFFEPTDSDGIAKVRDLLDEWEAVAAATIIACQADGINIWSSQTPFGNQSAAVQQSGGRRVVESEQEHRTLPRGFNPYDLIPAGSSMYTYEGSLTTPPCTEIVFWNVIDTPVSVSVLEFIRIVNLVIDFANPETCTLDTVAAESGFTGRPVQAINGRKIERICPTGFVDPLAVPDCPEPTTQASETAATGTSGAACAASVVTAVLMLLTGIALV